MRNGIKKQEITRNLTVVALEQLEADVRAKTGAVGILSPVELAQRVSGRKNRGDLYMKCNASERAEEP